MTVTWGDAIALVDELQQEPGSHLQAALADWTRPAPLTEVALWALLQTYLRSHTDRPDDVVVPMPWLRDQQAEAAQVTPEERARLVALLAANSAFRDP